MRLSGVAVLLLSLSILSASCRSSSSTETPSEPTIPAPTQLTGQQLSQSYCGSCHQMPDPSMLDKTSWQTGVLPQMALRMGQSDRRMQWLMSFNDTEEMTRLLHANLFPDSPTLNSADWQKIVAYYTSKAPDKLPAQSSHTPVRVNLPLFQIQPVAGAADPMVTLLRYDSLTQRTWVGDRRGMLYTLDKNLKRTDSLRAGSPPTDLIPFSDGSFDLLTVGVLNPNDKLAGMLRHESTSPARSTTLLSGLERPVRVVSGDLNHDGRSDLVICQFGNYLGKLSWYEQLKNGYREHPLDSAPGARQALVRDVNNDGWPDVVALLTQGDEQIAVYYNLRNGQFRKETVLRFPPVYGSAYLDMTDIDGDGDADLIYTNGDNADYSIVLKPYHGVRIFRNDGHFHFKQAWFFPMHGASQTVIRDFDQDGDIDIAAIAHFPDFSQQPNQSFIYFENQGDLTFQPRTFASANRGRWLTMETGDVDQDGDSDILLGSFFRPTGPQHASLMEQWRKPGSGVWLLRNTLK